MARNRSQASRRRNHHGQKQALKPLSAKERMSFKNWDELKPRLIAEVRASEQCSMSDIGWMLRHPSSE